MIKTQFKTPMTLDNSTKKGKPKLVDDQGYTYTLAHVGRSVTAWSCTFRHAKITCLTAVQQREDKFTCEANHTTTLENLELLPMPRSSEK